MGLYEGRGLTPGCFAFGWFHICFFSCASIEPPSFSASNYWSRRCAWPWPDARPFSQRCRRVVVQQRPKAPRAARIGSSPKNTTPVRVVARVLVCLAFTSDRCHHTTHTAPSHLTPLPCLLHIPAATPTPSHTETLADVDGGGPNTRRRSSSRGGTRGQRGRWPPFTRALGHQAHRPLLRRAHLLRPGKGASPALSLCLSLSMVNAC